MMPSITYSATVTVRFTTTFFKKMDHHMMMVCPSISHSSRSESNRDSRRVGDSSPPNASRNTLKPIHDMIGDVPLWQCQRGGKDRDQLNAAAVLLGLSQEISLDVFFRHCIPIFPAEMYYFHSTAAATAAQTVSQILFARYHNNTLS